MWGNQDIKDNELWGISEIHFTELKVVNKVYCTYAIGETVNTKIFDINNTKIGNYLPNYLPNYVNNNGILCIKPEVININSYFDYPDLDLETKKYLYFGSQNIATEFLNIFSNNLLLGKDITQLNHKYSFENCNYKKKIIEFWNNTELDNPHLWRNIAKFICKNCYAIKKYLIPKNITEIYDYAKKIPIKENKNLGCELYTIYCDNYYGSNNFQQTSGTHTGTFSFALLSTTMQKYLKKNINNITIYSIDYKSITINILGEKIAFYSNINSREFKLTYNYNTKQITLPPIACLSINYKTIFGHIKTDFKIECPQCIIETDLNILACRSEYFKTYINSELYKSNSNLKLKLDSQWDLRNLVNFIIDCECEITDPKLELQIADYYKCAQYKTYVDNWLKVNNLMLFYEIYKLW